jgi:hypothetical protein
MSRYRVSTIYSPTLHAEVDCVEISIVICHWDMYCEESRQHYYKECRNFMVQEWGYNHDFVNQYFVAGFLENEDIVYFDGLDENLQSVSYYFHVNYLVECI